MCVRARVWATMCAAAATGFGLSGPAYTLGGSEQMWSVKRLVEDED